MATATPEATGPVASLVPLYFVPCSVLAVIALGLCIARVYTRLRPSPHLYLDDYLIIIATFLSIVDLLTGAGAAAHGWGGLSKWVTPRNLTIALKCSFALQTIWVVTIALVRLSVATSLMRFGKDWKWRGTLWALITMQILTSTGWLVVQFAQCRPLRSNWEAVANAKCWGTKGIIDYAWFSAAYYCLMDLVLALLPIKLLRSLSRPLREKVLIGVLMATGLLATSIAGVKMTTFNAVGLGDPLYDTVRPSLYAKLEEQVGIIAACMPALKGPAERVLRKIGVLTYVEESKPSFIFSGNRSGMGLESVGIREIGEESERNDSKTDERSRNKSISVSNAVDRGHAPADRVRREAWEAI